MHEHLAEAMREPDVIGIDPDLVCLRFETMKIYSALGAVRRLLDTGQIVEGDTLVDSSSGIYAHALALACHRHGLHCHIIGSATIDRTLRVQLEILGATVELMPPGGDLGLDQNLRVRRIGEILAANPSYHWMRQYHDDIHYEGYRDVATIIERVVPAGPISLVCGVGTGASSCGLARYLRAAGRDVRLSGIQPFGSVTFGADEVADPDMIIAGIGSSIEFGNVRHEQFDRIHWISFEYAMSGAVELLRRTGIFAGLSSGAAYLAAEWERARDDSAKHVFLAPDTGHRYVDVAFSRHAEAIPIDEMRPREIDELGDIDLPWCTLDWQRRPDVRIPEQAPRAVLNGVRR